jgi:hypothetical protein
MNEERKKPDGVSDQSWQIFKEVKANHATLAACKHPHDFEPDPADTLHNVFGKRQRCKKCGGTMDSIAARYYCEGLEHGRAEAKS